MDADIVPMDLKKKITISWSGGKDSAFALHKIMKAGDFEIVSLHTVFNEETKRVGMHGVKEELIERQAQCIGLPLKKLYLESSESHSAYEKLMQNFYQQCANEKIEAVVFGDIFLEDLKIYREQLLQSSGLKSLYPLWKLNTSELIQEFIGKNFETLVCAANAAFFSQAQMGQTIDEDFLKSLPMDVDPCGENGEFHTFVYDGPIFSQSVDFKPGEVVKIVYNYQIVDELGKIRSIKKAFWFQDLLS